MRLIRLLKKDLATEISTWVDQQLISVDQARSISRLYGVDYDRIRSRSTAYRVLVVLGFLFIGLSLITVIGANWDTIPRGVRMAGLLVLTAGTHGLAMRQYRSGRTSPAVGLFILGNLFYGASIILIAQIYHLGEHMPDGVFWWRSGACRSRYCCATPGSRSSAACSHCSGIFWSSGRDSWRRGSSQRCFRCFSRLSFMCW